MPNRLAALVVVALMLRALVVCAESRSAESAEQKAVLVTGASTGLGRAIAERMAEDGYFVYAGARKQSDLNALNAVQNIEAVRIDVTIQDEIDAAVATVRAGDRGLYALINNAGAFITGPSAEADIDDVKWLFDVNVYGVMRMSSAFAPLLIENNGRIINIGSQLGSVGVGYLGPYSMSKHAIEAYTEALHAELAPLGVSVSMIKPGSYSTNIWKADVELKRVEEMRASGSPFVDGYEDWLKIALAGEGGDPIQVADVALKALSDQPAERRYLIQPYQAEMDWVMNHLIDRLADLNRNNRFAWSAERLWQALEAASAGKAAEPQ